MSFLPQRKKSAEEITQLRETLGVPPLQEIFFAKFPMVASAGCGLSALLVAAIILWCYPISRHHAAFISVTALLVLAFATLHYFPHLRHAT